MYYYIGNRGNWKYLYNKDTGEIINCDTGTFINLLEDIIFSKKNILTHSDTCLKNITMESLMSFLKSNIERLNICIGSVSTVLIMCEGGKYIVCFPKVDVKPEYSLYGFLVYVVDLYVYIWYKEVYFKIEREYLDGLFVCVGVWRDNLSVLYKSDGSNVEVLTLKDFWDGVPMSKSEFIRRLVL